MSQAYTRVRLTALTAADFGTLAQLAETIWRAHYTKIIGSAQVDYMLAGRYTPEKLSLYLNTDDRWLMLLRTDKQAVGYCSYALTENPGEMKPPERKSREMKLEQLYLLPEYYGQGLGRLMLQVNKHNDIAVAFYRKAGFTVREEAVFDIGGGFVMDDYVMEKLL